MLTIHFVFLTGSGPVCQLCVCDVTLQLQVATHYYHSSTIHWVGTSFFNEEQTVFLYIFFPLVYFIN